MNKRAMLLSVFLAFGLLLSAVPRVAADPPPWAGGWNWVKHHHHDDDDDDDYDRNDNRYDRNDNGYRNGYDYRYRNRGYDRYDQCSANMAARMNKDRGLINQWQGTGRHQKVVRWAYEDMANARRDLANCRGQVQNDSYDPYYGPNSGYDPYSRPSYDPYYGNDPYSGTNGGFEWKRDWPLLLGTVINGQIGVGR